MSCIFCKIIAKEVPTKLVYEDDDFIAFHDINPQAPKHLLVIPRQHIVNLYEADNPILLGKLMLTGKKVAFEQGLTEKGARFVLNCKEDGGQTVDHIHLHILGGRAMQWPPG
ncbi:MAG: histidine triad nucleotide-binding protein [Fibrobacter sp.]|nr:histidine triad nucleotide-binding protein [Fibrobacter sp.]